MLCNLEMCAPHKSTDYYYFELCLFLPAKSQSADKCRRDESGIEKKIEPWNENGRCLCFKSLAWLGGGKWNVHTGLCKSGTMWHEKHQQQIKCRKTTSRNIWRSGWNTENLFHPKIFYFGLDKIPHLRKQCSCSADVSLLPKILMTTWKNWQVRIV